ncbi:MAG: hypothetical protein KF684_11515 [Phycisphaeraceae bacterium]|nr:hypothetical protein [Phycisphaeraceae bacterium]
MPRLTALRVGALRELAQQFRFAPRARAIAALAAVEALAREIDPERAYAEHWLVHRLTGYRPENAQEGALFAGEALYAELSALAEHICGAIALREDETPGALRVEDLCARWSVSRRTLERYRRRGLVARRVRAADGEERIVFTPGAVEGFETLQPALLARAGGFRRTTGDERAMIVRRARRYRARFGCTVTQASERIALRTGRARETVRRVLLAHDRAADDPIFPRARGVDERRRDALMHAHRRGVPLAELASATGRTRESVARIALERTLVRLRAFDLRGPVAPTFERDDAHEVLLAPPLVREGLLATEALDASAFVDEARAQPPLDPRDEATLATALAFLRFRARRTLASLPAHSPSAAALDRAETDLRWAHRLVVKLARTQRRVALGAIEERVGGSLLDLPDPLARAVHLAAMRALADAALRFDPFAKGRLAGRAAVALTHALTDALRERRETPRAGARRSRTRAVSLDDWTRDATPWGRFVEPGPRLTGTDRASHAPDSPPDNAPDSDEALLWARFGLDGRPPLTLEEVGAGFGLTLPSCGARVRKATRAAMGLNPTPSLRRRYPPAR